MLLRIHPDNPEKRFVSQLVQELKQGAIYILPTDTVYALVASLGAHRAINEIYRLKNLPETRPLALLCRDVAMASQYAQTIPNSVFRFMKAHTPGPYTFILRANRQVDRRGVGKKKEVGVRFVGHALHQALMEQLDIPLISTSLTTEDEYFTDPDDLLQQYGHRVAGVVDGGVRPHVYSTILDCQSDPPLLVRAGEGAVEDLEHVAATE